MADWVTDWAVDQAANWVDNQVANQVADRVAVLVSHSAADRVVNRVADQVVDRVADQVVDRVAGRLADRVVDRAAGWVSIRVAFVLFVFLSVCLSICPTTCLLTHPPVYLYISFTVCLSLFRCDLHDPPAAGRPPPLHGRLSLFRRGKPPTFFPCSRPRTILPPRPAAYLRSRSPILVLPRSSSRCCLTARHGVVLLMR